LSGVQEEAERQAIFNDLISNGFDAYTLIQMGYTVSGLSQHFSALDLKVLIG
jgi:hypothetical protein